MTSSGKLLKLFCIGGLFVGALSAVLGIVLLVASVADIDAWVTTLEGVGTSVLGARSAILANVPSNTERLRTTALLGALAAAAIAAFLVFGGQQVESPQHLAAGGICVVFLGMLLIAHRIVREQLSK